MTTITINIPEQQVAVLTVKAKAQGLTLEDWFRKVAEKEASPPSTPGLQKSDFQEWARPFDAWVDSHDPNTPILSDHAMSRDSIYPDRS